jgi:UDP-GlcNAc:undecaprenyl-phosphate GlcNAc-1-phosphate transferase
LPDEVRVLAGFAVAFCGTVLALPLVIRLAQATDFLDRPQGYKGHARPTPYLGGLAVMVGFLAAALAFGGGTSTFTVILLCALALFVVGTVDDRIGMGPLSRVLIEAAAAVALWAADAGWAVFDVEALNLLLTIVWVVGIVNAFNLMDNMDGAAGSVAAACACGIAFIALAYGEPLIAGLMTAVAGACAGFLPANLGSPARIFLGDGGSMPLGLILASAAMALGNAVGGGWTVVLAAAPLVGLAILDTTLVVISRRRRGAQILSGSRDHLTHRVSVRLGPPRTVALWLVLGQAALSVTALAMLGLDSGGRIAVAAGYFVLGAAAIWLLELPDAALLRGKARSAQAARSESSG